MFSALKDKELFDVIIYNAPFHGNEPQDDLERGVSDFDYQGLRKFFSEATSFLKKDGEILLAFSDTGDLDLLKSLIIENKLLLQELKQETKEGWTCLLFRLTKIHFNNIYQEYIYNDDHYWFKQYKKYVISGNILKVGAGLGYASYFISLFNRSITTLDVVNNNTIKSDLVTLYDGKTFPYPDNHFNVVICSYTLHHIKEQDRVFFEMHRVTKKTVLLIEEIYENFFRHIKLIYVCWSMNRKTGQKVKIYFNKYYSQERIDEIISNYKLKVVNTAKQKSPSMAKFFVLEK